MIAPDEKVVAGELVIMVAPHRRMARPFHLKHAVFHGVSA